MGKKNRIKRAFRDSRHPSQKASASESASTTSGTALKPGLEPRSKGSTDTTNGASSTSSQSHDAPVRDLWGLALEKLSKEEKAATLRIVSDSKLDILEHLRTKAEEKRKYCEDKRWKFELNGRQIILRDVAEKIIVWIDKFKQVGDIAVNFDPVHASLPWAGVRFLLEVRLMIHSERGSLKRG